MKLKEFLALKDPSKVPDKEFLLFHLRLHQWFGDGSDLGKKEKEQIIRAHTITRFEFVRRSLRHKCMSTLDEFIDQEIFDEEFSAYYTSFVESVSSRIPTNSECRESIREKLDKLHTSIHSLWNLVSKCKAISPTEDFLNAHDLLVGFLVKNCKWKHPNWDMLDENFMRKVFFFSNQTSEKPSVLTLYEFLESVPDLIVVAENFVRLDLGEKRIEIGHEFGRKLVQVCYFRVLRFLRPRDWNFEISHEPVEADLEYDLVLKRISPFLTFHLSLRADDFGKEIKLTSPYLFLVGGLASRGYTSADIDLLLRAGLESERKIKGLILESFGDERISFVKDEGLAPYTSYVGLMDLCLKKRSR